MGCLGVYFQPATVDSKSICQLGRKEDPLWISVHRSSTEPLLKVYMQLPLPSKLSRCEPCMGCFGLE